MTGATPGYQRFFAELKRRRVFRVMAVYGAVSFVVLQVADIALPGLGLPEWTITLILALALLGFPFVIVLAWAFETTPEGVKRTTEAAPDELRAIISAPASQRWPAGVMALVGMTALLAGVWYMGRQSAPASSADMASGPLAASIAVLPFVNMSSDLEQEYFSDGISEELLNLLAKIPELQVASRTSAFSFKGQNLEIPEIAQRLNVAHILEGSVRKSDDRVRVTAQLIDARSDKHLWSETWDRSLDDIFAIQDEIAADVVGQLQITLLGAAPTVEETDPEAYTLVLQARHLGRQFTVESLEQSNALYESALEIEPDYAEAYATLSGIANGHDNDLAAAAQYMERALELDPTNSDILGNASGLASGLGQLDEAIGLAEYMVSRDPVNAGAHGSLGRGYLTAGRLDEAMASFRTALRLSPGSIRSQFAIEFEVRPVVRT